MQTQVDLIYQRLTEAQIAKASSSESAVLSLQGKDLYIAPLKQFEGYFYQNTSMGVDLAIDASIYDQLISNQISTKTNLTSTLFVGQSKYPRVAYSLSQNNMQTQSTLYLTNSMIEMSIYSKLGQAYDVQNLTTQIEIGFSYLRFQDQLTRIQDSQCVYLNQSSGNWTTGQQFEGYEVKTVIDEGSKTIKCLTTHLSTFTVISKYSKNQTQSPSNSIKASSLYLKSQEKYFIIVIPTMVIFAMIEVFGFYTFSVKATETIKNLKNINSLESKPQSQDASHYSSRPLVIQNSNQRSLSSFQAFVIIWQSLLSMTQQRPILWVRIQNFFFALFTYTLIACFYFSLRTQFETFLISDLSYSDAAIMSCIAAVILFIPLVQIQSYFSRLEALIRKKPMILEIFENSRNLQSKEYQPGQEIQTIAPGKKKSKVLSDMPKFLRNQKDKAKQVSVKNKTKGTLQTIQQIMEMDDHQNQEMNSAKDFLRSDDQSISEREQQASILQRPLQKRNSPSQARQSRLSAAFGGQTKDSATQDKRTIENLIESLQQSPRTQQIKTIQVTQLPQGYIDKQNTKQSHQSMQSNSLSLSVDISEDLQTLQTLTIPTTKHMMLGEAPGQRDSENSIEISASSHLVTHQSESQTRIDRSPQPDRPRTSQLQHQLFTLQGFQSGKPSSSVVSSGSKQSQGIQYNQSLQNKIIRSSLDNKDKTMSFQKIVMSQEQEGGEQEQYSEEEKEETKGYPDFRKGNNQSPNFRSFQMDQGQTNQIENSSDLSRIKGKNSLSGFQMSPSGYIDRSINRPPLYPEEVKLSFQDEHQSSTIPAPTNFVNIYTSTFSNNNIIIINNSNNQSFQNFQSGFPMSQNNINVHTLEQQDQNQNNITLSNNNFLFSTMNQPNQADDNSHQYFNDYTKGGNNNTQSHNEQTMPQFLGQLRLDTSQINQQMHNSSNTGGGTRTYNNTSTNLTQSHTPSNFLKQSGQTLAESQGPLVERQIEQSIILTPKGKELATQDHQERLWLAQKAYNKIKSRMWQMLALNFLLLVIILILFGLTSEDNLLAVGVTLLLSAALNIIFSFFLSLYLLRSPYLVFSDSENLKRISIQNQNMQSQIDGPNDAETPPRNKAEGQNAKSHIIKSSCLRQVIQRFLVGKDQMSFIAQLLQSKVQSLSSQQITIPNKQ